MRAAIVYESIYGNTLDIAEAIAAGLRAQAEVSVLPVRDADPRLLAGIDLLVVGGPTHAWGMTRRRTREQAITDGRRKGLRTEARHGDPGLREWLGGIRAPGLLTAAFDTRIKAPPIVTGGATRGIVRRLRQHGLPLLTTPTSFFVRNNQLLEGEVERARRWGNDLGELATKHVGGATSAIGQPASRPPERHTSRPNRGR